MEIVIQESRTTSLAEAARDLYRLVQANAPVTLEPMLAYPRLETSSAVFDRTQSGGTPA